MATRDEYFKRALAAQCYRSREWIIGALSVVYNEPSPYPFQLRRLGQGAVVFLNEDNAEEPIEGNYEDIPLFQRWERLTLNPGDLPNIQEPVDTSYYEALFNAIVLAYPFNDKVPYYASDKPFNEKEFEKMIVAKLIDEPTTDDEREQANKEGKIFVSEWLRCGEAIGFIRGLSILVSPSGSKKTFVVSDEVIKRRDELLAEHAEQLDDPAVLARIEKELVEMDQADFKGDEAETFFVKPGKQFGVARKKLHIMYGKEYGFGTTGEGAGTILRSLNEPGSKDDLVIMNNATRSGSYSRGKETELGGEIVKLINQVFQNTTVVEQDCGTAVGMPWTINEHNAPLLLGMYEIQGNDLVELTEENVKERFGKEVTLRSPMGCRSKPPGLCATCMGAKYGANPKGLTSAASTVPSRIMYIFMSAFHGKALKTNELVLEDVVS